MRKLPQSQRRVDYLWRGEKVDSMVSALCSDIGNGVLQGAMLVTVEKDGSFRYRTAGRVSNSDLAYAGAILNELAVKK